MTILSGLIAVFNRLLGSAATATVGWATIMLFGRVSQKKQQLLSLIALGSLVWVVAVVAVVVPAIGHPVARHVRHVVSRAIGVHRSALQRDQ